MCSTSLREDVPVELGAAFLDTPKAHLSCRVRVFFHFNTFHFLPGLVLKMQNTHISPHYSAVNLFFFCAPLRPVLSYIPPSCTTPRLHAAAAAAAATEALSDCLYLLQIPKQPVAALHGNKGSSNPLIHPPSHPHHIHTSANTLRPGASHLVLPSVVCPA